MQITARKHFFRVKTKYKKSSTNYGQVHHDAVHIKQGEKMIITHSEAKFG